MSYDGEESAFTAFKQAEQVNILLETQLESTKAELAKYVKEKKELERLGLGEQLLSNDKLQFRIQLKEKENERLTGTIEVMEKKKKDLNEKVFWQFKSL